ncbi:hypothetical protein [Sphingorhabdus sp. 109]|uniref:hypothetical protein n=1 Tax=Sphingorhabdus sp. 109 TaxID=2653173 RepID=UPI0012EF6442|nr:hypothetical protein [Sphingorhabdus sp. 109]VWX56946.1 hypothetical protein SPHINGOR109_10793 [Sphingorhabdus sp. 109]
MSTDNIGKPTNSESNVYLLDEHRQPSVVKAAPMPKLGTKEFHDLVLAAQESLRKITLASELAELQVATPIVVFHVSYGRNAWHSTWIARYTKNTLLRSRVEARSFIRARLKQGTSYRMTVMPGWHLAFSDNKSFLVTEINTSEPFKRLANPAFARKGITKRDALNLLKPDSEVWKAPIPRHDSIVVQETKRPASDFMTWSERTEHPSQVGTPGRYKRTIVGNQWWMSFDKGLTDYDISYFEAILEKLET